jgi:hypothetical protein
MEEAGNADGRRVALSHMVPRSQGIRERGGRKCARKTLVLRIDFTTRLQGRIKKVKKKLTDTGLYWLS